MLRPLSGLFRPADYPDLLVGLDQPDDAAVYRLDDERALVATKPLFSPANFTECICDIANKTA